MTKWLSVLHSKGRGFDSGGRNQKYHNSRFIQTTKFLISISRIFCSLYDEILNYDIFYFDLRDRTLALFRVQSESFTTWPSRPDFFPIGGGNGLYGTHFEAVGKLSRLATFLFIFYYCAHFFDILVRRVPYFMARFI
jgi:hypothetical protein